MLISHSLDQVLSAAGARPCMSRTLTAMMAGGVSCSRLRRYSRPSSRSGSREGSRL